MKKRYFPLFIALAGLTLTSCSDKDDNEPKNPLDVGTSDCLYVLNQGNLNNNIEGGLSVLDYATKTAQLNVFKAANNRSLGDTPQCGVAYGSKIYVGTSMSKTIEVFDATTYKSIKQFRLSENPENGTTPYSMIAHDGKIFISMYDGYLARLDTLTMTIDKSVAVGPNPDQIALFKGKIFVPVSDGMNWPNYGTTACAVDPTTMSIEKTFVVDLNPTQFLTAGNQLFLLCKGNYNDIASRLFIVNDDYTVSVICDATLVESVGDKVAIINQPWTPEGVEPILEYRLYDVAKKTVTEWNIERPDYANRMYYDKAAGKFMISSYVIDGKYPSYVLPGYVNVYDAATFGKIYTNTIGAAGPACMFSKQK